MMHLAVAVNDRSSSMIPFLVSLFTWSKAYHCELIFSDGTTISASPEHVGYRNAHYGRYKWVLVPLLQIDEITEQNIRKAANELVDKHPTYDYIGAIFGRFKASTADNDKWYCSELCRHLLRDYISTINDDKWITPDRMWSSVADDLKQRYPEIADPIEISQHSLRT